MRFAASLRRPSTRAATSRFSSISAAGSLSRYVPDGDYFAAPVEKGDPVVASWNPADINILTSVDKGAAEDPYSDATH